MLGRCCLLLCAYNSCFYLLKKDFFAVRWLPHAIFLTWILFLLKLIVPYQTCYNNRSQNTLTIEVRQLTNRSKKRMFSHILYFWIEYKLTVHSLWNKYLKLYIQYCFHSVFFSHHFNATKSALKILDRTNFLFFDNLILFAVKPPKIYRIEWFLKSYIYTKII